MPKVLTTDSWKSLPYAELRKDVMRLWGMSDWSASVIGLSHFGLPDVWPGADGSLKRALVLVQARFDENLDPDRAAPFRSYLARSLWAALDCGYLATELQRKL